MLKIWQNWGKIANYPPQCATKICTTVFFLTETNQKHKHANKNLQNHNILATQVGY